MHSPTSLKPLFHRLFHTVPLVSTHTPFVSRFQPIHCINVLVLGVSVSCFPLPGVSHFSYFLAAEPMLLSWLVQSQPFLQTSSIHPPPQTIVSPVVSHCSACSNSRALRILVPNHPLHWIFCSGVPNPRLPLFRVTHFAYLLVAGIIFISFLVPSEPLLRNSSSHPAISQPLFRRLFRTVPLVWTHAGFVSSFRPILSID